VGSVDFTERDVCLDDDAIMTIFPPYVNTLTMAAMITKGDDVGSHTGVSSGKYLCGSYGKCKLKLKWLYSVS